VAAGLTNTNSVSISVGTLLASWRLKFLTEFLDVSCSVFIFDVEQNLFLLNSSFASLLCDRLRFDRFLCFLRNLNILIDFFHHLFFSQSYFSSSTLLDGSSNSSSTHLFLFQYVISYFIIFNTMHLRPKIICIIFIALNLINSFISKISLSLFKFSSLYRNSSVTNKIIKHSFLFPYVFSAELSFLVNIAFRNQMRKLTIKMKKNQN